MKNTTDTNKPRTLADIQRQSLALAREIDGADHPVQRTWSGRCIVCGLQTSNDPRTPRAPIHVA
jgi:hypothetical protein